MMHGALPNRKKEQEMKKRKKRKDGVITECPGCALNQNDDAYEYLGARKMNNCYK